MIGLEFICKVFDIQYKEVAEKIGVSNQTVTDWIKGKTSRIPEKRLNDLQTNIPEFSNINKELFSKEISASDKQTITTIYLIQETMRQIEESMSRKYIKGLDEANKLNQLSKDGLVASINLKSLMLISEHLIDNREFMNELDELIFKYKPSLKEHLRK
ncbi:helix-turn-helix domain-containing protein [Cytobacillus sp. FSL H8-0458]|uniref:helix-turn-helix domain-containing protein n=1 Tax=Cytobacillus sp. FSL H8-0458 TaxID=2975346 RepID=UPI0030F4BD39